MKKNTMLRGVSAATLLALLAACSTAEQASTEPPLAPSTSSAEAEQRLAAVARERSAIDARFAEREVVCYDKFFVNHCLDEAKEQRRVALVAQRAIEIEAGRYLRQAKVDERDRAMAAAEAAYREEEARLAAEPVAAPAGAAAPKPRARAAESRTLRNQQRVQENAARAEQDAATRAANAAANVAAFEERKRKSEERQKEVARRVAEREASAARRAAEAATKNPATPPAPIE